MLSQQEALSELRDYVVATGSAYLRNVRWIPGTTCQTCGGIPSPGFDRCYQCAGRGTAEVADAVGFVTYGWDGSQAGHQMYAYKASGPTTHALVSAVLTYAVVVHWNCIARESSSLPTTWANVPSLSGRPGEHPLALIAQRVMSSVPRTQLRAGAVVGNPRSYNPDHFNADPVTGHVLLLDDTWTSGGHFQSAAGALKRAGADRVTGLVVARWLQPDWAGTRVFIESLVNDFNPDICPFGGIWCSKT